MYFNNIEHLTQISEGDTLTRKVTMEPTPEQRKEVINGFWRHLSLGICF